MPDERRRPDHPRVPVQVPALTTPVDAIWNPSSTEARNLSQSGVLLQPASQISVGATVRVTLRLQRRTPLTLVGRVAWTRPDPGQDTWALGVEFAGELSGDMVTEIALDGPEPPPEAPPA